MPDTEPPASGIDLFAAYKAKYYGNTGSTAIEAPQNGSNTHERPFGEPQIQDQPMQQVQHAPEAASAPAAEPAPGLRSARRSRTGVSVSGTPAHVAPMTPRTAGTPRVTTVSRSTRRNTGDVDRFKFATSTPAAAYLPKATADDILFNPTSFMESAVKRLPNGFTDLGDAPDVDFSTPIVDRSQHVLGAGSTRRGSALRTGARSSRKAPENTANVVLEAENDKNDLEVRDVANEAPAPASAAAEEEEEVVVETTEQVVVREHEPTPLANSNKVVETNFNDNVGEENFDEQSSLTKRTYKKTDMDDIFPEIKRTSPTEKRSTYLAASSVSKPLQEFSTAINKPSLQPKVSELSEPIAPTQPPIRSPVTSKIQQLTSISRKRAIPSPNVAGFQPSRLRYSEFTGDGGADVPKKPSISTTSWESTNISKSQPLPPIPHMKSSLPETISRLHLLRASKYEKVPLTAEEEDDLMDMSIQPNTNIIPRDIYNTQEVLLISDLIDSLFGLECTYFIEKIPIGVEVNESGDPLPPKHYEYRIVDEYLDSEARPTTKLCSGSDYRDYPLDASLKNIALRIMAISNDRLRVTAFAKVGQDGFHLPNCRQALHVKICDLLETYNKQILVLESKANSSFDGNSTNDEFSIQSLWLDLQPVISLIRNLAMIVDNISQFEDLYSRYRGQEFTLKGGQLLSMLAVILHKYAGDSVCRKINESLLNATAIPFVRMILRWVHAGELHDPFGEFFVKIDEGLSQQKVSAEFLGEYWEQKYSLRTSMVPIFLHNVATDITNYPLYDEFAKFLSMVSEQRNMKNKTEGVHAPRKSDSRVNRTSKTQRLPDIMETLGIEPITHEDEFFPYGGSSNFSIARFDDVANTGYSKQDLVDVGGSDKVFYGDSSEDLALEILHCGKYLNAIFSREVEISSGKVQAEKISRELTEKSYSFESRIKAVLLSELTEKYRNMMSSLDIRRIPVALQIVKKKMTDDSVERGGSGKKGIPRSILIDDVDPVMVQGKINAAVDALNDSGTNYYAQQHVCLGLEEDALYNQPVSGVVKLLGGGNLIREIKISYRFANQMLLSELFLSESLVQRFKFFRDFFLLGNSEFIVNFLDYTTSSSVDSVRDERIQQTELASNYLGGLLRRRAQETVTPLLEREVGKIDISLMELQLELAIVKSTSASASNSSRHVSNSNDEMDTGAEGDAASKLEKDEALLKEMISSIKCELSPLTLKEQLLRITGISSESSASDRLGRGSSYYTYLGDFGDEEVENDEIEAEQADGLGSLTPRKGISNVRVKDLTMSVRKSAQLRSQSDMLRKKERPLIDGSEFLTILHHRKQRTDRSMVTGEESTSLSGLDSFMLSMELKFPVSLIFNRRTLTKYQLLFRHLFQCKFLEQDLGRSLLSQIRLQTELDKIRTVQSCERLTAVKKDLKSLSIEERTVFSRLEKEAAIMTERRGFAEALSHTDYFLWTGKTTSLLGIVRWKILHFIRRFQYFISFEVIEDEFSKKFLKSLESVQFVDEVLKLHDQFLDRCLKGTLLTNPELVKILTGIFDQTKLFIKTADVFIAARMEEVETVDPSRNALYADLLSFMQNGNEDAYRRVLEERVVQIAKLYDMLADFDQLLTLGMSELMQTEQFYAPFM